MKPDLPDELLSDTFLNTVRDLLRDTLTAGAMWAMFYLALRFLITDAGFWSVLGMFFLATGVLTVVIWYSCTVYRSMMLLEDVFEKSPHKKIYRLLITSFVFTLVILVVSLVGREL